MRLIPLIFAVLWLVTSGTGKAQESLFDTSSLDNLFSNQQEFLPVEEAFRFDFNQQQSELEVYFAIADGYYMYRDKFKFTANKATFEQPELPLGTEHHDEYFGVQQVFYNQVKFTIDLLTVDADADITITYQGCADKGLCYPPTKKVVNLAQLSNTSSSASDVLASIAGPSPQQASSDTKALNKPPISQQDNLAARLSSDNLLWVLLSFFGLGVLLSFTPCVFPMYPILTGIIVGQGNSLTTKKAFALSFSYVQGMAITYTILGVVVALAGAQFQAAFQHPIVLVALSILFIVLALSMFGVFNLALPSSWQNKLTEISNGQKGGAYSSVFTMGAISGLVASPCTTAPLTGALIYIAQSGDVVVGASALYALSLGMGLPLLVLGSSGGKLLPKAGNWMTVIKNIFGFLLLAVPIFLLERFIDQDISQLLWALLIFATASYFYVVNSTTKIEARGFWFGVRACFIFALLFTGAIVAYQTLVKPEHVVAEHKTGFVHVNNLAELQQQIAIANQQGLTVMVDLYADWCIACKEFEQYTFPKANVQQALANSVMIQIDLTDTGNDESIELMQHFNVFGLPSILFFDTQGNELTQQRVTGFMAADPFAAHINRIFNQ
ncbi:protein-disulfide reductase DsbD [Thalassotalea ponticola]|uniref:protein-disulfide reductase DsbD n=1 Tax=Thalassotalea ponticola TaxID=1523392 RepID=UPI0025B3F669|nr:protein-disulfide reductase DsbD [Thalassotalea ponticola]MDN3653700.1 protein-disulfide reductase DsbD [Thalassotalea ponticola]